MSYHLILPFFPEELRALLLDPFISDLMINGTTGVYADRAGVVQHIPLSEPYTNDRLQAAIERVAQDSGPGPYDPESDPQYPPAGRLPCGRCWCAIVHKWSDADDSEIQPLV